MKLVGVVAIYTQSGYILVSAASSKQYPPSVAGPLMSVSSAPWRRVARESAWRYLVLYLVSVGISRLLDKVALSC